MKGFVNMLEAEYRAAPGVSYSALKVLPRRHIFHAKYVSKAHPDDEPTRAMELGTVIHSVALLGKSLDEVARVYPASCLKKNGAKNPTPCEEFEKTLPPWATAMKEEDFYNAQATVESLQRVLGDVLTSPAVKREQAAFWKDHETQLDCKSLIDILAAGPTVFDIKTTTDASPSEFRRKIEQMMYWLQDATYSEGVEAITGKPCKFYFVAVETKWPYQCGMYELKPYAREQARTSRARMMRELADCLEAKNWEDAWEKYPTLLDIRDYAFER